MTEISPTDKSDDSYKAQFRASPQFRKFWESLFHGADLSDKEVGQLTDNFVKNVADNMNQVLKWALDEQKKRESERKENEGG